VHAVIIMASAFAVSIADVFAASARIAGSVHATPLLTCEALNSLSGKDVFFKCELFQKTGSFKARGACNAVLSLSDADAARGVVTHSSGNHAQALAYAAQRRAIPAHIVMPSNAPAVKKAAVIGYGARVTECAPTQAARESSAAALVASTGGRFVHPSEDPLVIAGQGTIAVELLSQV
jgi:threonine dehydratase